MWQTNRVKLLLIRTAGCLGEELCLGRWRNRVAPGGQGAMVCQRDCVCCSAGVGVSMEQEIIITRCLTIELLETQPESARVAFSSVYCFYQVWLLEVEPVSPLLLRSSASLLSPPWPPRRVASLSTHTHTHTHTFTALAGNWPIVQQLSNNQAAGCPSK